MKLVALSGIIGFASGSLFMAQMIVLTPLAHKKSVMILGVRADTPAVLGEVDGDYTPIAVDKYGHVRCSKE